MAGSWIILLLTLLASLESGTKATTLKVKDDFFVKISDYYLKQFYKCLCRNSTSKCTVLYNRDIFSPSERSVEGVETDDGPGFDSDVYTYNCKNVDTGSWNIHDELICTKHAIQHDDCSDDIRYQQIYIDDIPQCDSRCVFISGHLRVGSPDDVNEVYETCDFKCTHLTTQHPHRSTSGESIHAVGSFSYTSPVVDTTVTDDTQRKTNREDGTTITNSRYIEPCTDISTTSPSSNHSTVGETTNPPTGFQDGKEIAAVIIPVIVVILVVVAVIVASSFVWRVRKRARKTEEASNATEQEGVEMNTLYANDTNYSQNEGATSGEFINTLGTSEVRFIIEHHKNAPHLTGTKESRHGGVAETSGDHGQVYSHLHDEERNFKNPYGTSASCQKQEAASLNPQNDVGNQVGDFDGKEYENFRSPVDEPGSEYSGLHEQARNFQNPYDTFA